MLKTDHTFTNHTVRIRKQFADTCVHAIEEQHKKNCHTISRLTSTFSLFLSLFYFSFSLNRNRSLFQEHISLQSNQVHRNQIAWIKEMTIFCVLHFFFNLLCLSFGRSFNLIDESLIMKFRDYSVSKTAGCGSMNFLANFVETRDHSAIHTTYIYRCNDDSLSSINHDKCQVNLHQKNSGQYFDLSHSKGVLMFCIYH